MLWNKWMALASITVMLNSFSVAAEPTVEINTDFAGGNVEVVSIEPGKVVVKPDQREYHRKWFYWYFEATADKPGVVTFELPRKEAGFSGPLIGPQGPAISTDGGDTWTMLHPDGKVSNTFDFEFTQDQMSARFAVCQPYVNADFQEFLATHKGNKHLSVSELTKSSDGRSVKLLQIGKPGGDKTAVIMTGRHHANESTASIVLEGFLAAVLGDSEAAHSFRELHVLYAIPLMDIDGIEKGDQGKNRKPHDHNRDYGKDSLYPEVDAVEKLLEQKDIRFALDWHNPTLHMDIHQVMYFVGTKQLPENNYQNARAFAKNIEAQLSEYDDALYGPLNFMKEREFEESGSNFNRWVSHTRKGVIMAATLEIPFAPKGKDVSAERLRDTGKAILRAWVDTDFVESELSQ